MDWQQPNQTDNALPAYSYFPFYQQDSNQPNYNYDDDNEGWDDDEENEGYQDQNAYYYNEHQNVDVTANKGGLDGVTEPGPGSIPPSTALATLENDIQNKAAILKAKLLEKRASSRGANKPDKEEATSAFDRPAIADRQESDSAIDKLVREARAAAEAQAKQKEPLHEEPAMKTNTTENTTQRVSPVGSTLTLTPTDTTISISSKARKASQKSSKQAKNAAKAEMRAQQLQQQQEASQQMSKARSNMLAKQGANQNVEQPSSDVGNKFNALRSKETKVETKDGFVNEGVKNSVTTAASRSEILGPNTEKKDSSANAAVINPRANMPSRSETLLSTATLQPDPSTALVPVVDSPTQVAAELGHGSVASYSRHFDDLDEWLEVTGYHDRGNRERTLSLHRRKAQLEREMAEIDRELEQTVSSRARSTRAGSSTRRTSSTVSSMPPPPAPLAVSTTSAQASPQTSADTKAGAKRARSPERQSDSQHADKHQRTNSASRLAKPNSIDRAGISSNALEIPFGPRRKTVSPGLNIRGAEKGSPDQRFGHGKNNTTHARTSSFSPTARRGSAAHDRSDHHNLRGRFATAEPSPKRPLAALHDSRSPVPSTWNAYRPAVHEPHRSAGFDHKASYRGRHFSDSRGGSVSHSRSEDNANTSSLGLGLQRGGCRYFMIKSWNHENVQAALNEGTWATQVQNEELFAEAYKNSRHVIFFFSVNNSKAFQGYARMESVPGAAPQPSWLKNLRWPSSPPFYVRWITTAETRFSRVGHLKNALNDGQAVLVGRDGQEIEEGCGAALCEAIDEESKWNGGGEIAF